MCKFNSMSVKSIIKYFNLSLEFVNAIQDFNQNPLI